MSDLPREKLQARREALKLRLERQRISTQARATGQRLCEAGVKFVKLMPKACQQATAPFAHLPMLDERFYWPEIPDSEVARWDSDAEREQLFPAFLQKAAKPDEKICVIWHPFEAGLRLKARELAANLPAILDGVHDVIWLTAASDSKWLIEIEPKEREIWLTSRPAQV